MSGVRLAIGSNAASVWWVNGQEVIGIYGDRQTVIDDGVSKRLTLKKGPNIVRAAIVNGGGATDFCARFLDADDKPLKGFTVRLGGVTAAAPPASCSACADPAATHLYALPRQRHLRRRRNRRLDGNARPRHAHLRYKWTIRRNNAVVLKEGKLDLSSGKDKIEITGDQPEMIYVAVEPYANLAADASAAGYVGGNTGRNNGLYAVGAAVAPAKIGLSTPRPGDFDAFWDGKLAAQAKVPINPVLTPVETDVPGVELSMFVLDALGSQTHGYVAKPAREGKFPALIQLQYAGVYALNARGAAQRAAEGWLFLNVDSHDKLPSDPSGNIPRNYQTVGNTDREKSYFLNMYLRDSRALDYLLTRPDWDGKTIVLTGGSMGGQQSLVLAGLRPEKITAVLVCVPAGADANGDLHGRKAGYPNWPSGQSGRDEDRALFRHRQFCFANQGAGDGGHGLHRHDFAARRGLDGAEPDPRPQGTAAHDRIRARQLNAAEGQGLPRENERNTRSSGEGRRVPTQRAQTIKGDITCDCYSPPLFAASLPGRFTASEVRAPYYEDTNNVPVSPEVHADRTVTFRLFAPKASEVVLMGSPGILEVIKKPMPLQRDDKGVWSLTVGPLASGLLHLRVRD